MDVRMFTVGPVQENCFLFSRDGASEALIVDPGDEAPVLLRAIEGLGLELKGILLTHTHFDHIGAVSPVAEATAPRCGCLRSRNRCWRTSTASSRGRSSDRSRATTRSTRSPGATSS